MTYEDIFDKIVERLHEERKFTVSGKDTIYIFTDKTFQKIDIGQIYRILRQLESDHKVLKIDRVVFGQEIISSETYFDGHEELIDQVNSIFGEAFDEWYAKYLLKKKSDIRNFDDKLRLRVYDMILDLQDAMALNMTHKVQIAILPGIIRFHELCPNNLSGVKGDYLKHRWEVLNYLKEQGVIWGYSRIKKVVDEWDEVIVVNY